MNRCEDYPCCGHELNDCDGSLYGSDASIKAEAERRFNLTGGYSFYDDNDYYYEEA